MPSFKVALTSNIKAGDVVRINVGPGVVHVRIPKGVAQGDPVFFSLSESELVALKNRSSKKVHEGKMQSGSSKASVQEVMVVGEKALTSDSSKFFGFDVVNRCSDFGLALLLGMAIGFCLLMGFISGVLYTTAPLAVENEILETPPESTLSQLSGQDEM